MSGNNKRILRLLWVLVLAGLLYFALRNAPLIEIWNTLKQLTFQQIAIILALNILVIIAMTARWWIIVHAENPSVPFLPLVAINSIRPKQSYWSREELHL